MEEHQRKLLQVFSYAKALNEIRNPIIKDINNQPWSFWLKDMPNHETIDCIDISNTSVDEHEKQYVFRVERPHLTDCPSPPSELKTLVSGNWNNLNAKVELITTVEVVNEAGEKETQQIQHERNIKEAFEKWKDERNQWIIKEKPAREAMNIFKKMYKLHADIEKESETIELVIGDGILSWKSINHPLLIQQVELVFDPLIPEFQVVLSNKSPELYSTVWRDLNDVSNASIVRCLEDMDKNQYSPLDKKDTDEFFIKLSTALSPEGKFTYEANNNTQNNEPIITREHVLFLRKRNLGFSVALESILEDIPKNDDVPTFLKRIVGTKEEENIAIGREDEYIQHNNYNGEDEDILFTKPANAEQLLAAKQLERNNAVLVQGPPGTGKTHTIANLVGHFLSEGKNVLITSYSEKALRVLREKIVDSLRPLCLPVLKGGKSIEELEKTLDAINDKRSSLDKKSLAERIETLNEDRRSIIAKLNEKREELKREINNEYRSIVFGGDEYTPKDSGKYVKENKENHSWIPSPVNLGSSLTLSNEEIKELYKLNKLLSEEEEKECSFKYPELYELLSPHEFEKLIQNLYKLSENELNYRNDLWVKGRDVSLNDLEALLQKMLKAVEIIDESDLWSLEIIEAGYKNEILKSEWERLIKDIEVLYNTSIENKKIEYEYSVELLDGLNIDNLKEELKKIIDHLKVKNNIGKLTIFTKPKWGKIIEGTRVNNNKPKTIEDFSAIINHVELLELTDKVTKRWDRQVGAVGGPLSKGFGTSPENVLKQYVPFINDRLNWHKTNWNYLVSKLKNFGFDWDRFIGEDKKIYHRYSDLLNLKKHVTDKLSNIIKAQVNREQYKALDKKLSDLALKINNHKTGKVNEALLKAITDKDIKKYGDSYKNIERLWECKVLKQRREELIQRLSLVASQWTTEIKGRAGIHGEDFVHGDINAAWKWTQLNGELERRSTVSIEKIQDSIKELEENLRKISMELANNKAWLKKLSSITLEQTQAIEGWKLTMKNIGKGTGKRAPILQAKARELTAKCQSAVPVWIMPLSRVVETFNPSKNKFDVVIIDEASQADILALVALYMGKQVVIVGDNEQVSPLAVGTKLEETQNLINTFLNGIPNDQLYTGQFSIYDLARIAGFQPVCLKEHFRCVAPIIQFSNNLSYKGNIIPLRDESNVTCKPPLVSYRVDNAVEINKKNEQEADSIVSLIMSCMDQLEYKDKTFGVISLLGEDQADLIQEKLQKFISPEKYDKAKIICGTSAQFQGDERDIIFISLVNAPTGKGPLRLLGNGTQDMMKKRYNVAASRACDQLWVVHSLNPDIDLKEDDLRLRLIRHAENPYALDNLISNTQQKSESEFENQVIKRLMQAGYRVTPQWKVGAFRIDIVVEGSGKRLAVECDGDKYHTPETLEDDLKRQAILERLGWTFARIRGSSFFRNPDKAMEAVFKKLEEMEIAPELLENKNKSDGLTEEELLNRVKARAEEIRMLWKSDDDSSVNSEDAQYSSTNKSKSDDSEDFIKDIAVSSFEDLGTPMISEKNKVATVSRKNKDIKKLDEKKLEQVGFQMDELPGQVSIFD